MSATATLTACINPLTRGETPSGTAVAAALSSILAGEATAAQTGAFLAALQTHGLTGEHLAAAAALLRTHMQPCPAAPAALDTCGTGGDGLHTLNVSTSVALVAAAAGIKVAKHGNRAASSRAGSADVLEALGIKTQLTTATAAAMLAATNFCFLFAPLYHPILKNVAAIRAELGCRTIFNVLGPLLNPAGVQQQVVGVYDAALQAPMLAALKASGSQRALVVHGHGGMDELSLSGPNQIWQLANGVTTQYSLDPTSLGLPQQPASALQGGSAADNAAALLALAAGAPSAYADCVALNAAAAFWAAGRTSDWADGLNLARQIMGSGQLLAKIKELQNYG